MKTVRFMCFVFLAAMLSINAIPSFSQTDEETGLNMSGVWIPDQGDGTYRNPVIHADYSDPDVIRVGADYYMTSSSFNCTPGLQILHSTDLVNWRIISKVFDTQNPTAVFDTPQPSLGVWAPSIRFHNDTFYVCYGDPDYGIYMAKSKSVQGPWSMKLIKPVSGWIDPCPFWDDNGEAYLVHAFAKSRIGFKSALAIHKLSDDGLQVGDSIWGAKWSQTDTNDPFLTVEGPKLYKRNGYYYIFAPAGGVTGGWQMVLRSTSITGPWAYRKVLAQGSTKINGPHQGGWVDTPDGSESWFLHFQDKGAYGRIVHLQPMSWKNDWPLIGTNIKNDSIGEPVLSARKPNVGTISPILTPQTSDKFDSDTLGLQWQWYANSKPGWYSLTENKGSLRLYGVSNSNTNYALVPNLLLQKFPADSFVVTTKCKATFYITGEKAGLISVWSNYAYVAISRKADGLYLVHSATEGSKDIKLETDEVYLRMVVAGNSGTCKFSYSLDGKTFTTVGTDFTPKKASWIGAKFGLFATKPTTSSAMPYADFAWFNIEKYTKATGISQLIRMKSFYIYPNPVIDQACVVFRLKEKSLINIEIYNALGSRKKSLVTTTFDTNRHSVNFDRDGLLPGLHFCKITYGDNILSQKFLVR